MNLNYYKTSNYGQKPLTAQRKNEPKRTQLKSHSAGIHLFMQNKANFRKDKMNLNYYPTSNYEQKPLTGQQKNKPKQTQFKPNFPPKLAHMITPSLTYLNISTQNSKLNIQNYLPPFDDKKIAQPFSQLSYLTRPTHFYFF